MQLWVGLGNPGPQYAMHRHNVGFMVAMPWPISTASARFRRSSLAGLQEGRIGGEEDPAAQARHLHERKRALASARHCDFYKLGTEALTVFHDELDLAPFKVKVKQGGGTAGHNGLRSIDQHLGPDFRRVRIGIGHPGHKDRVTGYVLGNYAKSEMDLAGRHARRESAAEADWLAKGDDARFMSELALRMAED
jgi:PTH1 family peptidyl-tRNA hydrolase